MNKEDLLRDKPIGQPSYLALGRIFIGNESRTQGTLDSLQFGTGFLMTAAVAYTTSSNPQRHSSSNRSVGRHFYFEHNLSRPFASVPGDID